MTSLIAKLGYVGITTPRFAEMRTWGPQVLGCMLGPDGADGAVRLKIDDADYRLSFNPGDEYKMAYAGWEVLSHRDLDAAIKRLEDNGANPDLLMNLGRHVGDQTVSYYIRTPGGFFIEYGWDGLPIDDLERRSPRFINFREGKRGDMWGYKFRMQPNEAVHPFTR